MGYPVYCGTPRGQGGAPSPQQSGGVGRTCLIGASAFGKATVDQEKLRMSRGGGVFNKSIGQNTPPSAADSKAAVR